MTSGIGVMGYISNDLFLDSRSFRGMRQHLLSSFPTITIVDLHGSQKKAEIDKNGLRDENVFDIQQGVCISLMRRPVILQIDSIVERADIIGSRSDKYEFLKNKSISTTEFKNINPSKPFYLFEFYDEDKEAEYSQMLSLRDIVIKFSSGVKTHKDKFAYSFTEKEMRTRIGKFLDPKIPDGNFRNEYSLLDTPLWQLSKARKKLMNEGMNIPIIQALYRPFDNRVIAFSEEIVRYTARPIMCNLDGKYNLALLVSQQQITEGFAHVFVTRIPADWGSVSNKSRESTSVFPLFLRNTLIEGNLPAFFMDLEFQNNLKISFLKSFSAAMKVNLLDPRMVFDYIYAILNAQSYRSRYASFLKSDFPRVPMTNNLELFHDLCEIGKNLVQLHLLESPSLDNPDNPIPVYFIGSVPSGPVAPDYPKFDINHVMINLSEGFENVADDVWNFHIGGYQVCHKWLKDRRGRQLSQEDIQHYQKIVIAIQETIRLMGEIDAVIEEHGGWPVQ